MNERSEGRARENEKKKPGFQPGFFFSWCGMEYEVCSKTYSTLKNAFWLAPQTGHFSGIAWATV